MGYFFCREYLILVLFFFLVSTTNNIAFNFNIPMTLHLIFRSVSSMKLFCLVLQQAICFGCNQQFYFVFQGSLMANMVLGMIILHKRYTPMKYLSVAMISVGITACTIASGKGVAVMKPKMLKSHRTSFQI